LAKLLPNCPDGIRLSEHLAMTDGNTIFRRACTMRLEGIVAKRRDKPYRSGRSPDWIKVKNPDAAAATRGRWDGRGRLSMLPVNSSKPSLKCRPK
jgi:bifunctional non-homologous end joining protein LigD